MEPVKPKPWHAIDGCKKRGNVAGLLYYALIPAPATFTPAMRALVELGTPDAVKALVEVTKRANAVNGGRAVYDLADIRTPEAREALFELFTHGAAPYLKGEAALGLGKLQDPRVFDEMLSRALDPDNGWRGKNIEGLGHLGDARSVEPLIGLLSDPNRAVKLHAVMALGNLKDPRALPALERESAGADQQIRQLAERAIFDIEQARAAGDLMGAAPKLVKQGRWRMERPSEAFLASKLAVHMRDIEVLGEPAYNPYSREAPKKVSIRVAFPSVCVGCLESTNLKQHAFGGLAWTVIEANIRREISITSVSWPLPMCVRCHGYGLMSLFEVKTPGAGELWVSFRFPNLAYYRPFVEANGLEWGQRVAPTGVLSSRHEQKERDTRELERALASWAHVQGGLGFHRYVELKHDLLELEEEVGPRAVREQPQAVLVKLRALADKHSLAVESLHDVTRIADQEIGVLKALPS